MFGGVFDGRVCLTTPTTKNVCQWSFLIEGSMVNILQVVSIGMNLSQASSLIGCSLSCLSDHIHHQKFLAGYQKYLGTKDNRSKVVSVGMIQG